MASRSLWFRRQLLRGIALGGLAVLAVPNPAFAQTTFRIPAQALDLALRDFGLQSGVTILADAALTRGKTTQGINRAAPPEAALDKILKWHRSDLSARRQDLRDRRAQKRECGGKRSGGPGRRPRQ